VMMDESRKREAEELQPEVGLKREKIWSTRLHIDNLPLEISDEQLLELFKICGPVYAAGVNRPEGFAPRSKTGSVVYDFPECAEIAAQQLSGLDVMGRSITIDHEPNFKVDPPARPRLSLLAELEEVSRYLLC
jgi:RNA recognition motif-containing protein